MKIKATIIFALIVFSIVGSISFATGQTSANNSVTFAPTTLSYVGNEGQSQLTRALTFIGLTNQSVTVTLVPTDLYDSNKGQTLSASNIEITPSTFSITGDQQQTVNVSLNTSHTLNGTYQGTILVTTSIFNSTTSNMQISNTSIGISALIQPELTLLSPSATSSLTYAPTTLSFFGTNGQAQLKRTLTFVGITNQSLTVNLTPTDLYDNNTGNTISSNKIEITSSNFTIQGNSTTVNVSLETSQAIGGTYSGTILLTTSTTNSSTNNLQVATTNIGVSATIQIGFSSLIQPQFYLVISIFIIEMIAFAAVSNDWPFKNYVVLIVTILALSIWTYMLFVYGFSQINGILTTIGTIFVAPFLIFITNYVRDQWSTENDKRKSVRDIENKGRADDIEMVRSVLGELETHFASFNPDPYPGRHEVNKKMETDSNKLAKNATAPTANTNPPLDHKILYNEDGKLSRRVWDAQCKQGVMSDLPLLELSIYYNFQNIYNGYYSWAIDHPETKAKAPTSAQTTVTSDAQRIQCFLGNLIEWFNIGFRLLALGDETTSKTSTPGLLASVIKDQPTSLEKFENFRQAYGKLETVLFIHLSYYMGLFVKANLNPLPIKFPRVNRIFLTTLIDYHILDTTKYPGNFEDHSRASGFIGHPKMLFARKRKKKIEQTQSESDNSDQSIKAAKERIDKWEMSARLLRDVFNEIYKDENVEKFYKMSLDDFEKRLLVVEQKVKDLDPIAKKYFEKEEEPSSQKQITTLDDFPKP